MHDKKMIFGRSKEIHEAVQTLADPKDSKKILIISGKEGSYHQEVARFSLKYVMDRQKFYDGAFNIDISNKF